MSLGRLPMHRHNDRMDALPCVFRKDETLILHLYVLRDALTYVLWWHLYNPYPRSIASQINTGIYASIINTGISSCCIRPVTMFTFILFNIIFFCRSKSADDSSRITNYKVAPHINRRPVNKISLGTSNYTTKEKIELGQVQASMMCKRTWKNHSKLHIYFYIFLSPTVWTIYAWRHQISSQRPLHL